MLVKRLSFLLSQRRVWRREDGEHQEGHLILRLHRRHRQEEGGRARAGGQDRPGEAELG